MSKPKADVASPKICKAERHAKPGKNQVPRHLAEKSSTSGASKSEDLQQLKSLYHQQQFTELVAQAQPMLKDSPHDIGLINLLGAAYLSLGKTVEGIECYQRLLAIHPEHAEARNNLGTGYLALGDNDQAQQCFETAIKLQPDYAAAYDNLGKLFKQQRKHEMALQSFQKVAALKPDYPNIYLELGTLYAEMGRHQEALAKFEQALLHSKNKSAVLNSMGLARRAEKNIPGAIEAFQQAIQQSPSYADPHNNLGNLLLELGRKEEAIACFNQALAHSPDSARIWNNLARATAQSHDFICALQHYTKALEIEPENPLIRSNRGQLLVELGRTEEGMKDLEHALEHYPDTYEAVHNLALCHSVSGNQQQAEAWYGRALKLRPENADEHRLYSLIHRYSAGDPHIAEMEQRLAVADHTNRMHLAFALSKAYEDTGDTDRSFDLLHTANSLRRNLSPYHHQASLSEFDKVKRSFRHSYTPLSCEDSSQRPIFIVGMPRSGTTLVEQILSSHSSVLGAGELTAMSQAVEPILTNVFGEPEAPIKPELFQELRDRYFELVRKRGTTSCRFTDKMPGNFQYIGFILNAIPEAKIVHTMRDPMAVGWSIYKQYFVGSGNSYAYDLKDIAHFYHLYLDWMALWGELYGDAIYSINYERLTEHQEEESQKLLAFCGLEWEPQCLEFHKNKRTVQTASQAQVRKGMYQGSSDAWRRFEKHLQPLKKALEQEVSITNGEAAESSKQPLIIQPSSKNALDVVQTVKPVFERHGARYENVEFRNDAYGMGIYPVDQNLPFRIFVPEAILLPLDELKPNGENPELRAYQMSEELRHAWADLVGLFVKPHKIVQLKDFIAEFVKLPTDVKNLLSGFLALCVMPDLSTTRLTSMLFQARTLRVGGKSQLLPLLDFANHSEQGTRFKTDRLGVQIEGKTDEEVTVTYNKGDVWTYLQTYHFLAESSHCYGITMSVRLPGLPAIAIEREFMSLSPTQKDLSKQIPALVQKGDSWQLSHVMMGNRKQPHAPKQWFKEALQGSPFEVRADELWANIRHHNLREIARLICLLDEHQVPLDHLVRKAALQYLDVMAFVT